MSVEHYSSLLVAWLRCCHSSHKEKRVYRREDVRAENPSHTFRWCTCFRTMMMISFKTAHLVLHPLFRSGNGFRGIIFPDEAPRPSSTEYWAYLFHRDLDMSVAKAGLAPMSPSQAAILHLQSTAPHVPIRIFS
jgi:hypothetical protein